MIKSGNGRKAKRVGKNSQIERLKSSDGEQGAGQRIQGCVSRAGGADTWLGPIDADVR